MKRRPDPSYYVCPNVPCMWQVAPVLRDAQNQPVYLCSQCGKQFPQATIDQEYRLRRMRGPSA